VQRTISLTILKIYSIINERCDEKAQKLDAPSIFRYAKLRKAVAE